MHIDETARRRMRDEEHVRLLGLFYYISAGITAAFGLFPLMYVVLGATFVFLPGPPKAEEAAAARAVGLMFASIGIGLFLVQEAFAAIKVYAGYCLRRKQKRVFCIVIGGITLLGLPFSTVLGVFTLLVLLRDSVREVFVDENREAPEVATF